MANVGKVKVKVQFLKITPILLVCVSKYPDPY